MTTTTTIARLFCRPGGVGGGVSGPTTKQVNGLLRPSAWRNGVPYRTTATVPLAWSAEGPASPAEATKRLIILPGLFGSKQNWRTISRRMVAGQEKKKSGRSALHAHGPTTPPSDDDDGSLLPCVISVDLRNHGESPHTSDMTYRAMADDVIRLVEQPSWKKPSTSQQQGTLPTPQQQTTILMGHSLGGRVAMLAASARPDLFSQLVVVDISPVCPPSPSQPHGDAASSSPQDPQSRGAHTVADEEESAFVRYTKQMKVIEEARVKTRKEAYEMLQTDDEGISQFLLTNLVAVPDGKGGKVLQFRINLDAIERFLHFGGIQSMPTPLKHAGATETAWFKGPTLFIRGTQSHYITDADVPIIHRLFPHAEVASLDAGHWPHAECPDPFVATLQAWLARNHGKK